jgi:hypothetical protein
MSGMSQSQWAQLVLQHIGAPVTQNNIDNLMRWMTAEEPTNNWFNRNNPLNASVGTGTVDGTGSYATLEIGAQYTAGMIDQSNMSGIKQALMADADPSSFSAAVVASPWASSHYGGDPNHIADIPVPGGQVTGGLSEPGSGGAVPAATTSSASGNYTGAAPTGTYTDASGDSIPTPPPGTDAPALDKYIQQYFGTEAWMLNADPQVRQILEDAVSNGRGADTAYIQGRIAQTKWWQSTSASYKNYLENQANNPAEFSFTAPGSQASQTLAQIESSAGQAGVQLDAQTAQAIATNALKYGWNSQQIQQAIGSRVQYNGVAGQTGNAGGIVQQLKTMAGEYYMTPTPQVLQSWAQNIAAGTQTIQQFQAQMAQNASLKWTGFASQIQQGNTMQQLTDNFRTEAAKTMEVDPSSIDFVNNPVYSKILDYVPPNSANGVHRVMTQSEMDQYLKSQPAWGTTQQARDQAAQLEQTITSTWGRIAS